MADPPLSARLRGLLDIAAEADAIEKNLDEACAGYLATHEPRALEKVRALSRAALEKEVRFASLWGRTRTEWQNSGRQRKRG